MSQSKIKFSELLSIKNFELLIVLLSACLLSIWAMKHTIALRNGLLTFGCVMAAYYLYRQRGATLVSQLCQSAIPILFMIVLFIWVITHYFLFSQDQILQLKELQSIWLRGFEAAFLGWVCGVVITKKPTRLHLLGYGLILGFFVLYLQYIPKVLASKTLFHPDPFEYIFYGKINGVLIGILLIAGLGGHAIDVLSKRVTTHIKPLTFLFLCILIATVPLYSFVYIFDAKNGIGLTAILGLLWSLWALWKIQHFFSRETLGNLRLEKFFALLVIILPMILIISFGILQFKHNPSWKYLVEDIRESVQLEKYPQWRSPSTLGYPVLPSGRTITPNVFERVSWATAGLSAVPQNYLGSGILQYPLQRALASRFTGVDPQTLPGSTHSGWLELTLSFGIPAIICIWGALIAILVRAIRSNTSNKGFIVSVTIALFCLYTVGELSNHHAVEILIFSILFLAGMSCQPVRKMTS